MLLHVSAQSTGRVTNKHTEKFTLVPLFEYIIAIDST